MYYKDIQKGEKHILLLLLCLAPDRAFSTKSNLKLLNFNCEGLTYKYVMTQGTKGKGPYLDIRLVTLYEFCIMSWRWHCPPKNQ